MRFAWPGAGDQVMAAQALRRENGKEMIEVSVHVLARGGGILVTNRVENRLVQGQDDVCLVG